MSIENIVKTFDALNNNPEQKKNNRKFAAIFAIGSSLSIAASHYFGYNHYFADSILGFLAAEGCVDLITGRHHSFLFYYPWKALYCVENYFRK